MLGMCGRQQHERRRVFGPTDCTPTYPTQKRTVADSKLRHRHQTSRRAVVATKKPLARVFMRPPRSLFEGEHPAEAEMVWSVVGGTVERSAAGRRRSMNRTGGLVHRLVCI